MITHATGSIKVLVKITSPEVVYNTEEEDYFTGGRMGATTLVQNKMEIYDFKPTYKTSDNKITIVSIDEFDFGTAFVGGVPGNKICGLTKGDNGYCKNYKAHADLEKGDVESAFYLTPYGTNLFLKPLVPLIIGDKNQAFLSQLG